MQRDYSESRLPVTGILVADELSASPGNYPLVEPAKRYEAGAYYGFSIFYLRGLAHLKNRQPKEAVTDFQEIVDHRGISPLAQQWVLAHLGLARAQASSGEIARARSSYQSFFTLLAGGEPYIPILKQSKAEYAKLR